jgi:hypothetical protein
MNTHLIFERDWLRNSWLRLLGLVDYCNRAIKQGSWHQQNVDRFYALKDAVLKALFQEPPPGAVVQLKLVPYYRRCGRCKDVAGNRMRRNPAPRRFDYYLELIPPCEDDQETLEGAFVELGAVYHGRPFCFHVPVATASEWGIPVETLPRAEWTSEPEFHRQTFKGVFDEIELLLKYRQPRSADQEGGR